MSEQDEKGFIKGEIVFIIFENNENHFSILKLKIHETTEPYEDKEIGRKGHFTPLQKGSVYPFHGALTRHPRCSMKYAVSAYRSSGSATGVSLFACWSSII